MHANGWRVSTSLESICTHTYIFELVVLMGTKIQANFRENHLNIVFWMIIKLGLL